MIRINGVAWMAAKEAGTLWSVERGTSATRADAQNTSPWRSGDGSYTSHEIAKDITGFNHTCNLLYVVCMVLHIVSNTFGCT